jgi:hypothetical protein
MMINKGPSWQNLIPVNAQEGYTPIYDKNPRRKKCQKGPCSQKLIPVNAQEDYTPA